MKRNVLIAFSIIFLSSIASVYIIKQNAQPDTLGVITTTSATDVNTELQWRRDLIWLHNVYRADNGLEILRENEMLNTIAERKAHHMMDNCYWDHHYNGEFVSANDAKDDNEYGYFVFGENLGKNFTSIDVMFKAWTLSPSHNANLLQTNVPAPYTEIGTYTYVGKFNCRSDKGENIDLTNVTVVLFGSMP